MPDPRQMSGTPRPEPGDPAGSLTVRVVQGSVVKNAPAGTPIHLIAVKSDGAVAKLTRPLGDDGRVRWDHLAIDGSAAYYALAVLARPAGQDRLMTAVIAPPPQVGVRVLLAGFAADSQEPAIDDLAEEGGEPPPPGSVTVDVRGRDEDLRDVREVELIEAGQPNQPRKAVLREAGDVSTASFADVAPGADRVYQALIRARGRVYRSIPFQLTTARGATVGIFVLPNLLVGFHMGAELDDERLWFQVQFAIANETGIPYDPGPQGLVVPLPRGFVGAALDDEAALRLVIDKDRGFVWRGPLPPGQREFVGTFALPVEGGRVSFDLPVSFWLFPSQIVLGTIPGMTIDVPAGAKQATRVSNGRSFVVLSNLSARPGERLSVAFRGLPQHPAWQRWAPLAVGFGVLGLIGWGLLGLAARRVRAGEAGAEGGTARRRELEARRERLYDQLVQLTRRQRAGQVGQARYAREGANLVKQLERVYAELRAADALEAEIATMQARRSAAGRGASS